MVERHTGALAFMCQLQTRPKKFSFCNCNYKNYILLGSKTSELKNILIVAFFGVEIIFVASRRNGD